MTTIDPRPQVADAPVPHTVTEGGNQALASVMEFATKHGATVTVVADAEARCLPYRWSCSACDETGNGMYATLPACRDDAKQHAAGCAPLPAVQAGYRLVPALIGTRQSNHLAYIPCPVWCTEDHTDYPYTLDDIAHQGDGVQVSVPTFNNVFGVAHCLDARLYSDPTSDDPRMRAAHVLVDDDTPLQAHLTEQLADKLADDLIAFATQLRNLARTARAHNAKAGDSVRSQADEALRRVREVQA